MPSPHPGTDVGLHLQPHSTGWELPPLRLSELNSKRPLEYPAVTSEACFLDPYPQRKKIRSPKNMEDILLFHIWKTEGPGAAWVGGPARPLAIGSFLTQSLISLVPLGPTLQVSVVLFHPVPTFITVLPVLFSFNDLPVPPTEESHLSKNERNTNVGV